MVGGYTPEKVALRRAIALAVDVDKEIRLVRRGQAMPAQGPIAPGTWGYDPAFSSEMSEYDPARAKALLDLYGYVDRDGDGWREQPDGRPLVLEYATQPDQHERASWPSSGRRTWTRSACASSSRSRKWPENLKASRAGKLMMWGVGWTASDARRRHLPRPRLRPEQGPGQQAALRPAGLQRRSTSSRSRCPTAPSGRRRWTRRSS